MVRPTHAIVDLSAIRHNVQAFRKMMAPSEVCTVVKADGYGHGDVPVATAALEAGASRLAVALVEEGIRLREAGISAPILVLSQPALGDAVELLKWDLTPSIYTHEFVDALADGGAKGAGVHVKLDTGMHRVGVNPDHFVSLTDAIRAKGLDIEGVFTHFPVADSDQDFTRMQIAMFEKVTADFAVPVRHMANTPGAILFPEARADFGRIGLGTYGLYPNEASRGLIALKPAMSLVSEISFVQRLPAGTRLSYGRARELDEDATVVTVPIGYADGFWRLLSSSGGAIIGGEVFPLAGTVTMDQAMFVVGDLEVGVGDEVVLIGAAGDVSISADDWADQLKTISYEVVCSIGPRVPRKYVS